MSEAEWLTSQHVWPLYAFAGDRLSERQARLFATACCRRIWHFLTDERSRHAVEISELAADGLCSQPEQEHAAQSASQIYLETVSRQPDHSAAFAAFCSVDARKLYRRQAHDAAWQAAINGVGFPPLPSNESVRAVACNAEHAAQAGLLRDIFGNPFRPAAFSSEWRTDTALSLARTMYESREFGAMPILADALQDAGCDNDDILDHCRGPGPHVRGCWVVDLVLGK